MNCNCIDSDAAAYLARFRQIFNTMSEGMMCAPKTNNISYDFITEMIPHHRAAVEMSKNALMYDLVPELVPILENIITTQEKGICQMEAILAGMQ